jgi:DNA-binding beta-propeller fold protein YncE
VCTKIAWYSELPPSIHSFSPLQAYFDAILTIKGENFHPSLSEDTVTVTFNNIFATVTSVKVDKLGAAEIKVEVPKNLKCSGPIRVTFLGKTATSTTDFTYVPTAMVSTLAGSVDSSGKGGFADGPGNTAQFDEPRGIAIDAEGNLYVADSRNHSIRKISPQGDVISIVGDKQAPETENRAQFRFPAGITTDGEGNLYVADTFNHRIRKIPPEGEITTLSGEKQGYQDGTKNNAQFDRPWGITIDRGGNLYVTDENNHCIRKVTPDGTVETIAGKGKEKGSADGSDARFDGPRGIVIDTEGNLYVADTGNRRIRKISPTGDVSTIAGSGTRLDSPQDIALDVEGNLYMTDSGNHRIRKISPEGEVWTIAGDKAGFNDGFRDFAQFRFPAGITIDAEGNLYVADENNHRIRKIVLE